jgi:hypothetical protein
VSKNPTISILLIISFMKLIIVLIAYCNILSVLVIPLGDEDEYKVECRFLELDLGVFLSVHMLLF